MVLLSVWWLCGSQPPKIKLFDPQGALTSPKNQENPTNNICLDGFMIHGHLETLGIPALWQPAQHNLLRSPIPKPGATENELNYEVNVRLYPQILFLLQSLHHHPAILPSQCHGSSPAVMGPCPIQRDVDRPHLADHDLPCGSFSILRITICLV